MTSNLTASQEARLVNALLGRQDRSWSDTTIAAVVSLFSLPTTILPKWYFGLAAAAGFGVILAGQLGYVPVIAWYIALAGVLVPVAPVVALYALGFSLVGLLVVIAAIVGIVGWFAGLFRR